MKKIISILLVLLVALSLYSATEPAFMISLAVPSFVFAETGVHGSYSLSELPEEGQLLFVLPAEVKARSLSLSSMLSENLVDITGAMFDIAMLYSGFEDSSVMSASGNISFEPSVDFDNGLVSLAVSYDDVSVLYKFGSRISSTELDGDVRIYAEFFTPSLFSVYIATDDFTIDGDSSYSGKSIELRIDSNDSLIRSYMDFAGVDPVSLRPFAASLVAETPIAAMLGLETGDDIIEFAETHDALDLLDTLSFFTVASSDPDLNELEIVSMLVVPSMYVDGGPAPDINLEKAMRWALDIVSFANTLSD